MKAEFTQDMCSYWLRPERIRFTNPCRYSWT